jgi:fumarate hydratase subunit beta
MPKFVKVTTPVDIATVESLDAGDQAFITGTIYTARDAAHKRLVELIKAGKELPFDINGAIIYYVGPSPAPPGKEIGSAGPTTSYRMDPYSPILMEAGLKLMIGKGNRSQAVIDAIQKYKAAYLAAIGGAGVVMSNSIKTSKIIAYRDLGTEAIRELQVVNFPCIVANDCKGKDIYVEGVKKFREE